MKFEDILTDVNGFGRFQKMIIVISFIGRFTLPCHFMLNNFISAVPSHHCDFSALDDGGTFENLSQAQRLVVSIPVLQDGTPSSCRMFAEPQYHLLVNSSNITDVPTVPCQNGWVYDNTTFKSTLTSEVTLTWTVYFATITCVDQTSDLCRIAWTCPILCVCWSKWDLVCDQRRKNKATATIFFVGVMFGAMSFGSLSDRCLNLNLQ